MPENQLRTLLDDATADLPTTDLTGTVVVGARRRRNRRRFSHSLVGAALLAGAVGVGVPVVEEFTDTPTGGTFAGQPDQRRIATLAPVDDTFSCKHTLTIPAPAQPEIYGSGPDFGVGHLGADRYEVTTIDGRKTLQVGDRTGTLTASVTLRPSANDGGGWVIGEQMVCAGPGGFDVAVEDRFQLGAHGRLMPAPPMDLLGEGAMSPEPASSPVAIDDRPYHNRIGVVETRTLYAYETGDGITVAEVLGDDALAGAISWESGADPANLLGSEFIPSNNSEWAFKRDFAAWAYYTHGDATLTGNLEDGSQSTARTFSAEDWEGTLHVLLAPADALENVTLTEGGDTRTFNDSGTRTP